MVDTLQTTFWHFFVWIKFHQNLFLVVHGVRIGSGNGLALQCQAITWANPDYIHGCKYASTGFSELKTSSVFLRVTRESKSRGCLDYDTWPRTKNKDLWCFCCCGMARILFFFLLNLSIPVMLVWYIHWGGGGFHREAQIWVKQHLA